MAIRLGAPVCNKCFLIADFDRNIQTYPWRCPCCGDFNLRRSLHEFIPETQEIIKARTGVVKSRSTTAMNVDKIVHRKFIYQDDPRDPNERYRPWLEQNVGKQGEMWNWDIALTNTFDYLEISFANSEHALLFELSCT